MAASLAIDAATDAEARRFLLTCCGSSAWVERMLARRPFGSEERLLTTARDEWLVLGPDDWREAFRHHPAIGDRTALAARFPTTAHLSEGEQRGVETAAAETLAALADANRAYLDRFGYIFIVCASGKSADEMLTLLSERLQNPPDVELRVAAEEQAKITALRLRRG